MGKKYRFVPDNYLILVLAAVLIAFSVLLFMAAAGNDGLYVKVMIGVGVVLVIIGFLLGAFAGVGVAIALIWVFGKLVDLFTIPMAILFLVGGIAVIILWIVDCIKKE